MLPSHCLYADDVIIFCRGNKRSIKALISLFQRYSNASISFVNPFKSHFFYGSMDDSRLHHIFMLLGFTIDALHFSYLGVPIFKGASKTTYFRYLVGRIKTKLENWKSSLLSFTGRVQLVKSTIQATLIHGFLYTLGMIP